MEQNRTLLPALPKEYKKVKWKAPFLFAHDKLCMELFCLTDKLGINVPIDSVYGGIPCSWDTNNIPSEISSSYSDIRNSIETYNRRNVSCCFTFNNYDVNEKMFYDELPNKILKAASEFDVDNYAIIASDALYQYIKDNYPKIKLISSVIRPYNQNILKTKEVKYYDDLCEKYDRVVIRAELNFDDRFLKKLKYKKKIEIIVNNNCVLGCKLRQFHYRVMTKKRISLCNKAREDINFVYNNTFLSKNDIIRIQKMGFEHFKLDGRGLDNKELFNNVIARYIFEPTGIIQPLSFFFETIH